MMPMDRPASASMDQLRQRVRQVEPAALWIRPSSLRRIVKEHRHLNGFATGIPLRCGYLIPRTAYEAITGHSEPNASHSNVRWQYLLPEPSYRQLQNWPLLDLLRLAWRQLFHLSLQRALQDKHQAGLLSASDLLDRQARIGWITYDEIRQVLLRDRYVLPPYDDLSFYVGFVALFWELHYFQPDAVPIWFPSLQMDDSFLDWMRQEVDVEALWTASRLLTEEEAATSSRLVSEMLDAHRHMTASPKTDQTDAGVDQAAELRWDRQWLLRLADVARSKGNWARSAMLRARLARMQPDAAEAMEAEIAADVSALQKELIQSLQGSAQASSLWHIVLRALVGPASRGIWPPAARMLFDLQKVCLDLSQPIFATDLVVWIRTLGSQPIRRPLIHVPRALAIHHLRRVLKRLPSAGLLPPLHDEFAQLLEACIADQEQRLRGQIEVEIGKSLDEAGLVPHNQPERISRQKVIAELCDKIATRGRITFGDLRDAISANQLKLADLTGPIEFLKGDPLLQADRKLAFAIDGLYRPGEFYLRWFQSLSSLAFGTKLGRFGTRYLAIPFGSAFCVLEFADHLFKPVFSKLSGQPSDHVSLQAGEGSRPPDANQPAGDHFHLVSPWSVLGLGFYIMGLIYLAKVREWSGVALRYLGQGLKAVGIEAPRWLMRFPPIAAFLDHPKVRWCRRHLLGPIITGSLTALLLYLWDGSTFHVVMGSSGIFLVHAALLMTRLGQEWLDAGSDALLHIWERIRFDFLPGLFRWIMDFFHALVQGIERILYTVDEWLRFRGGEKPFSVVLKTILGLFWFCITYVIRFAINLLIEPQINPLKHFPVVTVSHKLLLPTIPHVAGVIEKLRPGYSAIEYQTFATTFVSGIPGIFGFLVWELKENWKLYAANRPKTLSSLVVGHHGETFPRLFRPGFHSGTIPKIYAKWRHAFRLWEMHRGSRAAIAKHHHALTHMEHDLRRFIEREGLAYLQKEWASDVGVVELKSLRMATQRIDAFFHLEQRPEEPPVVLTWWEQAQRLSFEVSQAGWITLLSEQQQEQFYFVMRGLIARSGVNLLHAGQDRWTGLAQALARDQRAVRLLPEGLTLMAGPPWTELALLAWPKENHLEMRWEQGQISFEQLQMAWEDWVRFWGDR